MRANTKPVPFLGLILRIWVGSQRIPGKFLPWSTSLVILLFLTCLCCNARICCALPTPWLFSLLASFQCQGVCVCKIQSLGQSHDKKSWCSSQKTATLGWRISLSPGYMWPLQCSNHADMHASGESHGATGDGCCSHLCGGFQATAGLLGIVHQPGKHTSSLYQSSL